MKFIQGFLGLLALSIGMIFAAAHVFVDWVAQAGMFLGAAIIIALDVFALLVWFVNWKYYPEQE